MLKSVFMEFLIIFLGVIAKTVPKLYPPTLNKKERKISYALGWCKPILIFLVQCARVDSVSGSVTELSENP